MPGIKDVLVVVDLAGKRPSLAVGAELATTLGAHFTGLSLVYETIVPTYAVAPVPTELILAAREGAEEEANAAKAAFEEMAGRAGVPFASFQIDVLGGGFAGVLRHCRLTDLVVIGQEDPAQPEPMRRQLVEAILLESGVPALVVPHAGAKGFKPGRALIGWDGSAPAAAAVHAALPLLEKATSIQVLIIDTGGQMVAETGFDIADYLARHDLEVEISRVPAGDAGIADTLLKFVIEHDIDFVVMGAYGHSRIREYIFGGATRDILSEMTVPVLMAR